VGGCNLSKKGGYLRGRRKKRFFTVCRKKKKTWERTFLPAVLKRGTWLRGCQYAFPSCPREGKEGARGKIPDREKKKQEATISVQFQERYGEGRGCGGEKGAFKLLNRKGKEDGSDWSRGRDE